MARFDDLGPLKETQADMQRKHEEAYSNAVYSNAVEAYSNAVYANAPKCGTDPINTEYVIGQLFTYHPANPSTGPKFETLREAAKYFAKVIYQNVPAGADRAAAIRKVREAVMTANAGISLGGLSLSL